MNINLNGKTAVARFTKTERRQLSVAENIARMAATVNVPGAHELQQQLREFVARIGEDGRFAEREPEPETDTATGSQSSPQLAASA